MWLRTALILVLALLVYRFLSNLSRAVLSGSRGAGAGSSGPGGFTRPSGDTSGEGGPRRPTGGSAAEAGSSGRSWPPGDVIDVPYREHPRDGTGSP